MKKLIVIIKIHTCFAKNSSSLAKIKLDYQYASDGNKGHRMAKKIK